MRTIQQLLKAEALSAWLVLRSHMLPQLAGHNVCGSAAAQKQCTCLREPIASCRDLCLPCMPRALGQWPRHVLFCGLQRLVPDTAGAVASYRFLRAAWLHVRLSVTCVFPVSRPCSQPAGCKGFEPDIAGAAASCRCLRAAWLTLHCSRSDSAGCRGFSLTPLQGVR